MFDQPGKGAHRIAHMAKTSRLCTIPENGNWLSVERCAHKVGEHHAVSTRLTRTDRIEKADDDHRQTFFLPIGQREEFIDRF